MKVRFLFVKRKKQTLEDFLTKRITENVKLFTQKELDLINNNNSLIKKIYILGATNMLEIYK